MRKLLIFFSATLVVALVFLGVVVVYYKPANIGTELMKALLQIVVVVVFGQSASLAVAEFNRQRQRSEAVVEFRRAILRRLNESYSSAKRIRRLLRVKGRIASYPGSGSPEAVQAKAYDQYLEELVDVQLALEEIQNEIIASAVVFSSPKELEVNLRSMQVYLNAILHEYQFKANERSGDEFELPLAEFPKVLDFVGPFETSRFAEQFVTKYALAMMALQSDMLEAWRAA